MTVPTGPALTCWLPSLVCLLAGPTAAQQLDTQEALGLADVIARPEALQALGPMGGPEDLGTAPALESDEVLRSSIESFPKILAAVEKAAAARAKVLSAQGVAYDSEWQTKSLNWFSGFYEGLTVDSKVVKPIRGDAIEFSGGYRISDADFPIYQDEYVTNDLGEINVGVVFALLQDRQFGPRRFALRQADLDLRLTNLELLRTQVQVQHGALRAYWRWVATGQKLVVYSELLDLAVRRDDALRRRIAEGDLAEIFLVENAQNLFKRQSLVVQAERDFRVAGLQLSLYLRDADGDTTAPPGARLPLEFPAVSRAIIDDLPTDLLRAMEQQVSLVAVDAQVEKERNRVALGENAFKPQLDLEVKLARDFGAGSETRQGNDVIVSLDVKYPLRRRKAQGQIDEARANIRSLQQERRLLADQLDAQVLGIAEQIVADVRFASITSVQVVAAQRLEEAERVKFSEGASDLLVVNLREERAADARIAAIDARLAYFRALADYFAATADFGALGIGSGLPR
ncbi:MAG: TolC family protein [Pseudomonadota bacterium]